MHVMINSFCNAYHGYARACIIQMYLHERDVDVTEIDLCAYIYAPRIRGNLRQRIQSSEKMVVENA